MKTLKYISAILLLFSIACSNDPDYDPVIVPEPSSFGVNEYGTVDFKTVEGIEIGVDTSVELEALHGTPEEITQAVDGIVRWQYLSEGIGFGVNTTTNIIDKIYLYSDLYEGYTTNYPRPLEEELQYAFGTLKAKHPTIRIDDADGNNWPYVTETLIEATNGEANGVYSFNFENLGRFIFISDSIDNTEGFVVQIILESDVDYGDGEGGGDEPTNPEILFDEAGANSQTFNVGQEEDDDLNQDIITVGGTGTLVENNGFIGVSTNDPSDDGATAVFTFDITTNATTAFDATLNLELAKRAKGSVSGTVSVTGYPDTPFSYEATSTVNGGSAPAIDFEFASMISLVSGTPLTVTITLDEMLTEGNTTNPIFRLSKVTLDRDISNPINPNNISFDIAGDNTQTFNVGKEDDDDLNQSIITVGGTGVLVENNNFIGVSTEDANDNGATAVFTFDVTTNATTAFDATLNLELAKRAKGSVSGTVSVTGYPDTPFSYEATSTENGGSAPAIDFEFASTISLVSGTPLTVTITLDEMLTEGNTTTPIFRLAKVIIDKN
ncbi:hypothetical protein [Winogradskyella arenosi]|uniref:Calx-beta domain-containing protein n=1 Tax=Winogradskyella arenosi TaxID=533325 RepID=A0A368ZGZ6_9FLAO|nr:hypothetical protein [Winogradskyella arenosi]RCW92129.1 hypothetical protein DFQ08_102150 [Winogradskyella arenosi]